MSTRDREQQAELERQQQEQALRQEQERSGAPRGFVAEGDDETVKDPVIINR